MTSQSTFLDEVSWARTVPADPPERERRAVMFASGREVMIEAPPPSVPNTTTGPVSAIAATVVAFSQTAASVRADRRLSEEGRAEKLSAALADAAREVGVWFVRGVEQAESRAATAEHYRYRVPALPEGDVFAPLADREIRDRLHGASVATIAPLLDDERVRHALLRSPLPLPEPIAHIAQERHRAAIDAADPAGRRAMEADRAAADWGRRAAVTLAAQLMTLSGVSRARLVELLRQSPGFAAFGITRAEIDEARRRLDRRAA